MYLFHSNEIIDYLVSKKEPVPEVDLLKALMGIDHLPTGTKELFEIHFALYHVMYNLKEKIAVEGSYLHLDPMRIMLVRFPVYGFCFHYHPELGKFCYDTCIFSYCDKHVKEYLDDMKNPCFDNLRDFYINENNISFGKSPMLKKLMKGVIVYAFKKGEIENALGFLGITNPTRKKIKQRYHDLALKYHPDMNSGNDCNMKILNRSYQVLQEAFGV